MDTILFHHSCTVIVRNLPETFVTRAEKEFICPSVPSSQHRYRRDNTVAEQLPCHMWCLRVRKSCCSEFMVNRGHLLADTLLDGGLVQLIPTVGRIWGLKKLSMIEPLWKKYKFFFFYLLKSSNTTKEKNVLILKASSSKYSLCRMNDLKTILIILSYYWIAVINVSTCKWPFKAAIKGGTVFLWLYILLIAWFPQ